MDYLHPFQIREVFSYTKEFKGNTFAFYIDDVLLNSPHLNRLITDILYLLDLDIHVLIIVGARNTINSILKRYNREIKFVCNRRIISDEDIELVQMASFETAVKLLNIFSKHKHTTTLGNWIVARGVGVLDGIDYQHAGEVASIQETAIRDMLHNKVIPIFPAIGWSKSGKPYSLEAIELASRLGTLMHADKLFYICGEDPAVMSQELHLDMNSHVDTDEIGTILRMDKEGLISLLKAYPEYKDRYIFHLFQHTLDAIENGIERVHILDGNIDGCVLTELFSKLGTGLMVYTNQYQAITDLQLHEVDELLEIMTPLIHQGVLVKRTIEDLQEHYKDYVCYKVDGEIYGAAALHALDAQSAEIAGVVVKGNYHKGGIGKKLIKYLVDKSKKLKYKKVFVLTTVSGDWFEGLGFNLVSASDLPPHRQKKHKEKKRESRVYCLQI